MTSISFSYPIFYLQSKSQISLFKPQYRMGILTLKFLDWSKLKAFADDKLNLAEKLKLVLGRIENIVGK